MLCQYRDIFGAPGTGVHRFRFLGTPIVDYIGTILLAMMFTKVTGISLVTSTILMFLLGILLHKLFCVSI